MKKIIIFTSLFILSACTSYPTKYDDELNNKYKTITPQPVAAEYANNVWTGNIVRLQTVIKLNTDGTGWVCEVSNDESKIRKIKYTDGVIYKEDGTRLKLSIKDNGLLVTYPYLMGTTATFEKDNSLNKASPFCKAAITLENTPKNELDFSKIPPLPEDYQDVVKRFYTMTLKDPDSAKYEFEKTPQKVYAVLQTGSTRLGWLIKLRINAKNGYGAYTGYKYKDIIITKSDGRWYANELNTYDIIKTE